MEMGVAGASLGVSFLAAMQERSQHSQAIELELKNHLEAIKIERDLHREQMKLDKLSLRKGQKYHEASKKMHEDAKKFDRSLHVKQLRASLEQHLQDVTSDLIVAGKEADRDMWEQRNAHYQTLLLSSTVMFGAGMAVIVEGELPESSGDILVFLYAVAIGSAFMFLFVAIVLCIRIVGSMSAFMYELTNEHQTVVLKLIKKAKNAMEELFEMQDDKSDWMRPDRVEGASPATDYARQGPGAAGLDSKRGKRTRTPSPHGNWPDAKASPPSVAEGVSPVGARRRSPPESPQHQKQRKLLDDIIKNRRYINNLLAEHYLKKRASQPDSKVFHRKFGLEKWRRMESKRMESKRRSQRKFPALRRRNSNPSIVDEEEPDGTPLLTQFEQYWYENLDLPSKWTMGTFYIGTSCLLIGICVLIYARFSLTLKNARGAVTFVVFVGCALVVGLLLAFCLKLNSKSRSETIFKADGNDRINASGEAGRRVPGRTGGVPGDIENPIGRKHQE